MQHRTKTAIIFTEGKFTLENKSPDERQNSVNHWYLHVDLDAFFASVEQLDNPEYRGKPVIVGGLPEDKRSVVSTASYEARKFGVHSAMPIFQAYKLCPQGIFLRGRMKRYAELSSVIMNIFKDFSPDIQQISIDEAFIDLTGTEKLFGSPQDTAMKIKKIVKEKTGLTVSIGLASSKYIAKIASGYSKPDGFFFVKPGEEKDFMQNLPLNKVWGVGPKTLESLKKHGITSTKQIYKISRENLELLFGKSMGSFLYNAVRGEDSDTFSEKPKTHSISAETTFTEDITDSYVAQTELLTLAQGIMFRLLNEGGYSKTAFIKIRYADFSTVSARQTVTSDILTLDSFFEILKSLFEKKYDKQKGIRLLGAGFENIKTKMESEQLFLFEDKEKKKSDVEKAILSFSKKHPDVKIQKARTLKQKIILFFLLIFLHAGGTQKIHAQTVTDENFSAAENFFTTGSTNNSTENITNAEDFSPDAETSSATETSPAVDFSVEGFWMGELTNSVYVQKDDSSDPSFSPQNPVFKQKVDLSAHLLLDEKYFFNGEFSDEFADSLLEMGYRGKNFLREVKIANRGILFPKDYSTAKNGYTSYGGNKFSPGAEAHFLSETEKIKADFFARYESSETKSVVFYGMNRVQNSYLNLSQFLCGTEFIFPPGSENSLNQIKDIYVQNDFGKYKDEDGVSYKKIDSVFFKVIASQRKIQISAEAEAIMKDQKIPNVIITFFDSTAPEQIITLSGSYSDAETFKGKIQSQFSDQINLSDYEFSPLVEIDGENALLIQSDKGFSPYLECNIYVSKSDANTFVLNTASGSQDFSYEEEQSFLENSFVEEDFFRTLKYYTKIKQKENHNETIPQFPFAKILPEIYLQKEYESDLVICVQTLQTVQNFSIGTNAVKDSVRVFINDIQDLKASYSKESGIVTLSKAVSDSDKIYITYAEDSSDFSKGVFSTAGGIRVFPSEHFSFDFSASGIIPAANENPYSAAVGSGVKIDGGGFSFTDSLTGAVSNNSQSNNFTAKNTGVLNIQKENLIETKKSYLIRKLNFSGESEQSFETKNIFEEKADYVFSMQTGTQGELVVSKFLFSGNLNFTQNDYTSAAHGIKTTEPIFNFFDFAENFRQTKNDKTVFKTDDAKISFSEKTFKKDVPLNISAYAKFSHDVQSLTESQNEIFIFEQTLFPKSQFKTKTETTATFSQKRKNEFFENQNYFYAYIESSEKEFSGGFFDSYIKKDNFSLALSQNFTDFFTPKIFISLAAEDTSFSDGNFSDSEKISLTLPFSLNDSVFSFGISRASLNSQKNLEIFNYAESSEKLFKTQKERSYFYSSIPFFELFESEKQKKIKGTYSAKYEFDFKRKLFYEKYDALIPSLINFAVARDTTTASDIYQIKGNLAFRAVNIIPLLNDEESWGTSCVLKFPDSDGKLLSYKFSVYSSSFLFLNDGSSFIFSTDGSLQTDFYWTYGASLTYSRQGKSSLTKAVISYFSKSETEFFITRKDSFSAAFGNEKNIFHQKYDYRHFCETKFFKNFATSSLINVIFTIREDNTATAFINFTLGGKMEF